MKNPIKYFKTSPEVIRLAVMMYIRYPLSLRQVEDILFERGIDICHETVRLWWNRFGPMLPQRSGSGAFIIGHTRSGDGIWTKVCQEGTRRSVDVVDERSGAAMLRKR